MTVIRIYGYDGIYSAIDLPGQTCGLEAADGNGEIHCYRLLDGVTAMRMRLEMNAYTEVRTRTDALEINFCVGGRFETRFSLRDHVLLKPGDMAVSCYDGFHGSQSESWFPLGYYEGICLEVDPAAAQRWLEQNAPAFSVDFPSLKANLLGNKWYLYSSAGPFPTQSAGAADAAAQHPPKGRCRGVLLCKAGRTDSASPRPFNHGSGQLCISCTVGGGT